MLWFPTVNVPVEVRKIGVNNERLFNDIDELVMDGIKQDINGWRDDLIRSSNAEMLEELLEIYAADEPKLRDASFSVVCDHRNNKRSDLDKGVVTITVSYQQTHCLNRTKIEYTLDFKPLIKP